MNVLHLSAECYPVAKTGGLGDVVGALPKYQKAIGINAMVIMPFYDRKFVQTHQLEIVHSGSSKLGYRIFDFQILKEVDDTLGFELYLVKIPNLLDRPEIYSYPDESEQFIAFQFSVLEWIIESGKKVDVFHCHDHHSGLVPFLMQHSGKYNSLKAIPSVFTIHNAQYQGWLGWDKFYYLPEVDPNDGGLVEWGDCINPLASAVKCAWKFTTVSPSYLTELSVTSNRLEFLFQLEGQKGVGIINGIDVDVWDPKTDAMISHNYSVATVKTGKQKNKVEICEEFDLDPSKPLITFIGRLVGEKGADKLADLVKEISLRNPDEFSFLILGSGDKEFENQLIALKSYIKNYNSYIGYDEVLSHKIYASADFILMPSRVEPCGLNQLYSLKYGTVPIVRSTGGLKDTVIDFGETGGYGIRFDQVDTLEIVIALQRAIVLFQDSKKINKLRKLMMGLDFSWNKSAQEYHQLYKSLSKKP